MSALIPEGKGEVTTSSMILKPGISFEEWQLIGDQLGGIAKGVMFWIGDWLVFGEEQYGEKYAQAMEITGYSYRTVKQAKYIAKKFPPKKRDERLTFTHYTAVAGEETEKAVEMLTFAAEHELTVEDLKVHRRGEPVESDDNKLEFDDTENTEPVEEPETVEVETTCPHCHKKFDLEIEL